MVTYPCLQVVSQSVECYPVHWHHCNEEKTSSKPSGCLQLSEEYGSSERLLRRITSSVHPEFPRQEFSEVRSPHLLDTVQDADGAGAGDDDKEKQRT